MGTVDFEFAREKVSTPSNFPATLMLSTLVIGWETYTPSAIEFWLDDVAFDGKQRIGCPAGTKP